MRFADTPFVTLDNYSGLTDNYVRAVAQMDDGSIMIGTSRGLNRYDREKISAIEDNASLKNDAILSKDRRRSRRLVRARLRNDGTGLRFVTRS